MYEVRGVRLGAHRLSGVLAGGEGPKIILQWGLDIFPYFHNYRNMESREADVARYADMLAAMGTEARLRVMRLLLSAHPDGMVVGDIQAELGIPASTLSHHLDKLKNEGLVQVRRERQFLWYSANTTALADLLSFLYAECCSRNRAIEPSSIVHIVERPGAVGAGKERR